ncbi:hypothetical protein FQN55_001766 [Onygenales sp. PD_40]|nr:hypothetical protein FQN55_001766 [Onygenales sp. PD_40]
MSNVLHKVKDAVTGHSSHSTSTHPESSGYGHGTHATGPSQGSMATGGAGTGPQHSSNVANKLDPRVNSQGLGAPHGAATSGSHTTTVGDTYDSNTGPQHSSNFANKLDPRTTGSHGTTGYIGTTGGVGSQYNSGEIDPNGGNAPFRGSALGGVPPHGGHFAPTAGGAAGTGMGGPSDNPFPHKGSQQHGSAGSGYTHPSTSGVGAGSTVGSGMASRTAGPHDSNLANKLDPRVDSDLDGSRTVGGNATTNSGRAHRKDPTDSAQVPPSVMSKHIGAPDIAHGDHTHDRERRHSVKTGDSLKVYGSGAV